MTRITKLTIVMITMVTNIRITVAVTEKKVTTTTKIITTQLLK